MYNGERRINGERKSVCVSGKKEREREGEREGGREREREDESKEGISHCLYHNDTES